MILVAWQYEEAESIRKKKRQLGPSDKVCIRAFTCSLVGFEPKAFVISNKGHTTKPSPLDGLAKTKWNQL